MNQDYMKTKPILPLVLSMSLPMVLSMLVNSLYNIVDSFFVARIISSIPYPEPYYCDCRRVWCGHECCDCILSRYRGS